MIKVQSEVIEIVKKIVDASMNVDENYLINATDDLDSLSVARLSLALEEKFNITFSLSFFSEPRSIADIVKRVSDDV